MRGWARWAMCTLLAAALLGAGCGRRVRSSPPADAHLGQVWTCPKDGKEMVCVPAGKFLMGSTEKEVDAAVKGSRGSPEDSRDEFADELPQREVYLDAYWIDKNLVTVAEYRKFCQVTGRKMPEAPEWGWKDHHPMVNVTWDDAVAYATWAGKRLPTEAEWEKAARGTDGRVYPWGNEWDASKCANSVGPERLKSTQPVGSRPTGASPCGALDMAGNVYEWCADWEGDKYYQSAPARNPAGPATGEARVLRGGSLSCGNPADFRCADRSGSIGPGNRNCCIGFRCVRGPA